MLYNFPIEPLEERYSSYWYKDVGQQIADEGCAVTQVIGHEVSRRIERGQFLDTTGTIIWKLSQLEMFTRYLHAGMVQDGDVIFLHDLWFPGLESLFYMRDGLGVKFKIAGMLHAGTYDPNDWTARQGMGRWGEKLEGCWLHEVDLIFVASEYHKNLVVDSRHTRNNVWVLPSFPRAWPRELQHDAATAPVLPKKQNIVVFPHRLAPEKDPPMFERVAEKLEWDFPDWTFVRTKDVVSSKYDYYQLLARSKIAVSTALQETWGIAMREAVLLGAVPLAPDRLSYPEVFDPQFLYDGTEEDLERKLRGFMSAAHGDKAPSTLPMMAQSISHSADDAVPRMLYAMRLKGWKV